MTELQTAIRNLLRDVVLFCEHTCGIKLRKYQVEPAKAIVESVINKQGLTFVVIFPRQSGKNELQAQIEPYLLTLLSKTNAEIVKISPSWKPQSQNAMRRLERVIKKNIILRSVPWKKESGYIYRVDQARIYFLSGAATAHIVGATASTLLECDEAQDVSISKWDKEINPMAASTNATRVFWGTAWTSQTLLAREKRAALQAEQQDGIRRVFHMNAKQVGAEVKAYKKFVAGEIAKLGRNHPFIRTQYFSEEIDTEAGMFPDQRISLMKGSHVRHETPQPGTIYVFTIDVAGEDEAASLEIGAALSNQSRDSTTLTVFEVDPATLEDPLIMAPSYHCVRRYLWTGQKHTSAYGVIRSLIEVWQPFRVVVDATGVGEPLASFLAEAFQSTILPFVFTMKSKSDLGWAFLAVIETGRYKEHKDHDPLQQEFYNQCANAQMEILTGPNKIMRWSVPDGTRDAVTNDLVHDDLLVGAALVSIIDDEPLGVAKSETIDAIDPLKDLSF